MPPASAAADPPAQALRPVIAVIDTALDRDVFDNGTLLPGIDFSRPRRRPLSASLEVEGVSHGTAIAQTILTLCPRARLLPLQLIDRHGVGVARPLAPLDAVFAWLVEHHLTYGIAVVCAALADTSHQLTDADYRGSPLQQAIATLRAAGVPTVAAAGNWYPEYRRHHPQGMAWPAILREVVSVGALQQQGSRWQLAETSQRLHRDLNTGCHTTCFVEPGAPGETSGAAARVAGGLAQLRLTQPTATVDELLETLNRLRHPVVDTDGLVWMRTDLTGAL